MKLFNETSNPPGCFFYVVPETGKRVPEHGATSLLGCCRAVAEHLRGNGYAVPIALREAIEDFCCKHTVPGQCDGDNRMPAAQVSSFDLSVRRVLQGAKSIASWWIQGKVSAEVAKQRADVCRRCPENAPVEKASCGGCASGMVNRLSQFVTGVLKGRKPEEWERGLEACRICGCPLRLKVWTLVEPVRQYMHAEQLRALPPHCWINTEP